MGRQHVNRTKFCNFLIVFAGLFANESSNKGKELKRKTIHTLLYFIKKQTNGMINNQNQIQTLFKTRPYRQSPEKKLTRNEFQPTGRTGGGRGEGGWPPLHSFRQNKTLFWWKHCPKYVLPIYGMIFTALK